MIEEEKNTTTNGGTTTDIDQIRNAFRIVRDTFLGEEEVYKALVLSVKNCIDISAKENGFTVNSDALARKISDTIIGK